MVMQEHPYRTSGRVSAMGKSSVVATCPFCAGSVTIFLWSIAGNGKKRCSCGAALHSDGIARKLIGDPNHGEPGRDADGEPGNVSE